MQRRHHIVGNLVLQREDIGELAVEADAQELLTPRRLDQLGRDADAAARLAHAALEHIAHVQLAAHGMDVDGLTLIGEGRVARSPADWRSSTAP
jgi:hypothetical protein